MTRVLNLRDQDYYRQDNNTILPGVACMPTARVMFYRGNGIEFSNPSDLVDDDYFMKHLRSDAAYEFARKKYPTLAHTGYAPNEIHGMYHSYLDLIVVGHRTSDFKTDLTFDDYVDRIKNGEVLMTSGDFSEAGFKGHAFCAIGLIIPSHGDPAFILADPLGDYRTLYTHGSGYAVTMDKDDFLRHAKPAGKRTKWGHVKI